MLRAMRHAALFSLCVTLGATPALAGAPVEQGPLSPCVPSATAGDADQRAYAWGIEIASSFSKDDALAEFDRVKQQYSELLGSYSPTVVETCDLHLGTALRYSARIGMESRENADQLCAKLQAAGGACIVQKN